MAASLRISRGGGWGVVFNITCSVRAKHNQPDKSPRKFNGNKHLFNIKEAAVTSWLIRETGKKHCKVKILLLPLFVIYKSYNDFFPWNIESIQSSGGQSTFIERVGNVWQMFNSHSILIICITNQSLWEQKRSEQPVQLSHFIQKETDTLAN